MTEKELQKACENKIKKLKDLKKKREEELKKFDNVENKEEALTKKDQIIMKYKDKIEKLEGEIDLMKLHNPCLDGIKMESTDIKLAIYEACEAGEITEEQRDELLAMYKESFLKSPVKKFVDKLEVIKKERPSEYDGPEEVKKFVDKNFDEIVKCANILEKEPEKLRKDDIAYLVTAFPTLFGGYALAGVGAAVTAGEMLAGGALFGVPMIIGGILLMSTNIIHAIVSYARTSTDKKVTDDLIKVKSVLAKADRSKLSDEDKKKVETMIRSIDDAETSVLARFKTVKESVDIKLAIYEACEAGEITEEQKCDLLKKVEDKVADASLLNKVGEIDPDVKDAEKKADADMQTVEA